MNDKLTPQTLDEWEAHAKERRGVSATRLARCITALRESWAENANDQKTLKQVGEANERLGAEIANLKAENAKLKAQLEPTFFGIKVVEADNMPEGYLALVSGGIAHYFKYDPTPPPLIGEK